MSDIESKTCLKFVERKTETDYVQFTPGTECSSRVGRQATGRQTILLGDDCYTSRTVTHEVNIQLVKFTLTFLTQIMHALGFWHEQSRPDRDEYVKKG